MILYHFYPHQKNANTSPSQINIPFLHKRTRQYKTKRDGHVNTSISLHIIQIQIILQYIFQLSEHGQDLLK